MTYIRKFSDQSNDQESSNELSNFLDSQLTMSSREIAELAGKQHRNVLADCDKLNNIYQKKGMLKIKQTPYIEPQNGQEYREYKLTKMQTMDLLTGYNIELRIAVNRRWAELEMKNQLPDFNNPALAARAWADQYETRLLSEKKVENLTIALDDHMSWVSIVKVATHNKVSEKLLSWRVLKSKSEAMGYEIKKGPSNRYQYQNLYHVSVFRACYPQYDYKFN